MKTREKQKNNNNDFILILTTSNNLEESKKIADLLIYKRIAACVNISAPVLSLYRWKDRVEEEKEFMLFIKTTRSNYPLVEELIQNHHSYEVPEILAVPMCMVEKKYAQWLQQNTVKNKD